MSAFRDRFWDLAYAALLFIAIVAGIFHAAQGRWAQAVLVTAAAAIGALLLISGWRREPSQRQRRQTTAPEQEEREFAPPRTATYERPRDDTGRYVGWLPLGVLSGFVATGIMTGALLLGYAISAIIGSDAEGANQIQLWFAALVDNTLTEEALDGLAVSILLHLIAGIGWAVIYTSLAEPRLSGTGFQRGVKFGLLPWVLSITVFFPLAGTGFLGLGIDAGPLPILGNLILHIVYGASLGKVYASNAVWDEPQREVTRENIQILEIAQKSMAIGLIPGAILGALIGIIASTVVQADVNTLMAAVLGLLVGSAVGVWVGSLAGLTPDNVDEDNRAGVHHK